MGLGGGGVVGAVVGGCGVGACAVRTVPARVSAMVRGGGVGTTGKVNGKVGVGGVWAVCKACGMANSPGIRLARQVRARQWWGR